MSETLNKANNCLKCEKSLDADMSRVEARITETQNRIGMLLISLRELTEEFSIMEKGFCDGYCEHIYEKALREDKI